MGCGGSTVVSMTGDAATREFDRIIEAEKAESELHFKLLTLGAGESGKSTIIKQLCFLHKKAVTSDEEKSSYVRVLHGNTHQCITTLIHETRDFGYEFTAAHSILADSIDAYDTSGSLLTSSIVGDILELWKNSDALAQTYARKSEFWILEGTEYYFQHAERFAEEDYSPTEEDIVMSRVRTTGVVETQLKYGSVNWSVVDVGGQRSERRKWMSCFDSVKAILYCVNLAGYCSVLFEDRSVNRMQESLKLFEETMNTAAFAQTPVFLILNKKDLFEKLIGKQPLTMAFPEYTGEQELRPCIEYIAAQYASKLKKSRPPPMVLLMAARVKKDVLYCFEDVKDTLLELNRKGIKQAQAKLDSIREQYRADQVSEMEKAAKAVKLTSTDTTIVTAASKYEVKPEAEEQQQVENTNGEIDNTADQPSLSTTTNDKDDATTISAAASSDATVSSSASSSAASTPSVIAAPTTVSTPDTFNRAPTDMIMESKSLSIIDRSVMMMTIATSDASANTTTATSTPNAVSDDDEAIARRVLVVDDPFVPIVEVATTNGIIASSATIVTVALVDATTSAATPVPIVIKRSPSPIELATIQALNAAAKVD